MEELRGAAVAAAIKTELKQRLANREGRSPRLAIIRVGEREDDLSYERGAKKRMAGIGIEVSSCVFAPDVTMEAFLAAFDRINQDPQVDGILLLRPLPAQLDEQRIAARIDPAKDVDGISPANLAKVFMGDRDGFAPCTAEAVVELLRYYQVPLAGRRAVVAGRSLVVGKPLAMLLLQENCTVTVCHSKTANLPQMCREADLLVAAVGKPRLLGRDSIAAGAVVVDVGIHTAPDGGLCGDVQYEALEGTARAATPVPGGVGAVTTAVLAKHVVRAFLAARSAEKS